MTRHEIRHFHLFAGLGGGARGFNRGEARVGTMEAGFRCLGGVDVDAGAAADFARAAGAPCAVLDLFSRDQYIAFHGHEPPADWREATPADIQRAAGHERPHIVFTSPPCKGFSGLLSETRSQSAKYQALNHLTVRGLWLLLEAWRDDPPEFVLMENVPRIATRGRSLLDRIETLLRSYGYAVAETTHDCGELGGLAQSRRRFLLVARHAQKVPPFLYEPVTRPLRAVGAVLSKFPLPGEPAAGPMHRLPALHWRTWVRLAFVEAGSDWRSLQKLRVENGMLADYALEPDQEWYAGALGVNRWEDPAGTVTGQSRPQNGVFAIADPRMTQAAEYGQLGVRRWSEPSGAVSGQSAVGGGRYAVADPRPATSWDGGKYRVVAYGEPAGTVIAGSTTGTGAFAVADPRPGLARARGDHYLTAGHYGVVPWTSPAYAVTARGRWDNGHHNVADPRLPGFTDRVVAVIRSLDGTWHRPFTTLELAALQGLVEPDEHLDLQGASDSGHRERIGNAVPPPAAQAIAGVMGTTLLLAWSGETFALGATPIWVRPVAVALSLPRSTERAA